MWLWKHQQFATAAQMRIVRWDVAVKCHDQAQETYITWFCLHSCFILLHLKGSELWCQVITLLACCLGKPHEKKRKRRKPHQNAKEIWVWNSRLCSSSLPLPHSQSNTKLVCSRYSLPIIVYPVLRQTHLYVASSRVCSMSVWLAWPDSTAARRSSIAYARESRLVRSTTSSPISKWLKAQQYSYEPHSHAAQITFRGIHSQMLSWNCS